MAIVRHEPKKAPTGAELLSEVLARGVAALSRTLAGMPRADLRRLLRARDEERVLVAAVLHPEILERVTGATPLLAAQIRAVEAKRRLLEADGGTVSGEESGRLLGISRQAVDKKRRGGHLLALPVGARQRYPVWQFKDGAILPGLTGVLAAFAAASPWLKAAFFVSRNARLGEKRPLELLRQGRIDDVMRAARTYGEHGTV